MQHRIAVRQMFMETCWRNAVLAVRQRSRDVIVPRSLFDGENSALDLGHCAVDGAGGGNGGLCGHDWAWATGWSLLQFILRYFAYLFVI